MQQKPKVRRRMTKRFFIVTFCALVLYVGVTFFMQQQELNRLKAEQQELQQPTQDAAVEKDKLQHMLETAKTDAYIESVAREKLGWVKQGETRYVFKQQEN